MAEFNQESVNELMDHIIKAMNVCLANKDVWKSDKKDNDVIRSKLFTFI